LEKVSEQLKLSETDDDLAFGDEGGQRGGIAGKTFVSDLEAK
jgi:hypothetical protein